MGAIDEFCRETGLDHTVVAGLGDRDDADYVVLATAFEQARDRRKQELRTASENGLTAVPRLLRPVVRALFS